MGYHVKTVVSKFFLPAKALENVLYAFEEVGFTVAEIERMRQNAGKVKSDQLQFDPAGNLVGIDVDGKIGWQEGLFESIARHVKSGSHFVMTGEDGSLWVWAFKDGKFRELPAKVSWNWK